MRMKRAWPGALFVTALVLALGVPSAQGAVEDPLFIYHPPLPSPALNPPPASNLEGPCGLAVNEDGNLYLSDYYHHVVDLFSPTPEYIDQLTRLDPLDGPCALASDGFASLYVNDYHRNVTRYSTGPFDAGTVIDGAPLNQERPTGVAANQITGDVYVNERDRIAVFDSTGTRLGTIGEGTIEDGYGLAYSEGHLYVPDAATNTVKVYDATPGETDPVAEIDGSGTPNGHFTSLRDAAIAVDGASGDVYLADDLQPEYAERPETVIYVFDSTSSYKGRLKYSVIGGLPVGLAVDNTGDATQGRVYVTSGNSEGASLYAYRPGAATDNGVPLPPPPSGAGGGSGSGVSSTAAPRDAAPTAAVAPASALEATAPAIAKSARHHKPKHRHRHPRKAHR